MKILKIILITTVFSALYTFSQPTHKVKIKSSFNKKKTVVSIRFNNEFGIQRKADNSIEVYKINIMAPASLTLKDSVETYGTKIREIKRFKGKVSKIDKKYFSRVNLVKFRIKNRSNRYIVKTRFFYCSFIEKYCSVDRQYVNID